MKRCYLMCNNLEHAIENTSDYLRGMRDARNGELAEVGASDDYVRGYGTQYEAEQQLTAMGLMQDKKMSIFGWIRVKQLQS